MDITPLIKSDQQVIQSYSSGRIRVSGKVYEQPVLVFPDHTEIWNEAGPIEALGLENFQSLTARAEELDVILLGCGHKAVFIPPSFRSALKAKGLVLEVMGTGAACRTYNVLMAEGRRVVAALYPA